MKTLAIRLEDDTHAQLMLMSQLNGMTLTDIIRAGIEVHLADLASQPDVAAKAQALAEAIDREAAERRTALQALLAFKQPAEPRKSKG